MGNKKAQTPHIYSVPGSPMMGEMCMENRVEMEKLFVTKVVELVSNALDVGYKDKRNFEAMLFNLIYDQLDSRYQNEGLLQQYFAHELENLAKNFKSELRIPQNIKVDHEHATHSKFSSIISYIEQNYVKIEDINSDGTFEKINEKKFIGCAEECDCGEAAAEVGHSNGSGPKTLSRG
jgi:putative IMPACT (imprinted ancient) family translation regulator